MDALLQRARNVRSAALAHLSTAVEAGASTADSNVWQARQQLTSAVQTTLDEAESVIKLLAEGTGPSPQEVAQLIASGMGAMAALLQRIMTLESRVEELGCRLATLEQQLAEQGQSIRDQEARMRSSTQRIMLGEVALTLDAVAFMFVYGERKPRKGMTVAELRTRSHEGVLTQPQQQRWRQLCTFVEQQGWTMPDVCTASSAAKELGNEDAHASDAAKGSVTLQQLQEWARKESPDDDQLVQLVLLLSRFGQAGKPLVPVTDIGSVIEGRDVAA